MHGCSWLIDNVTLKVPIQAMKRAILLNTVLNIINLLKLLTHISTRLFVFENAFIFHDIVVVIAFSNLCGQNLLKISC